MKKTPRAKSIYWQRLRKDWMSNISCGFATISIIITFVMLGIILFPGSPIERKFNILYWIFALPVIFWGNGITYFKPWLVLIFVPSLVISSSLSFLVFYIEYKKNIFDFPTGTLISSFVCLFFAIAAYITYRRSMLYREGPFKGQP